ncbi:MAG: DUF4395 domain-containing protein [Mycobacteriales bacterium]
MSSNDSPRTTSQYVDPRGSRFAAWVTTLVLSVVVLSGSGWLLAAQTLVFAAGALVGIRYSPYSAIFRAARRLLRLGPPSELEAGAPLRFAQTIGAAFGLTGTVAFAAGWQVAGTVAAALALGAAFLNAAFGICLGCEIYLILRRSSGRDAITRFVPARTTAEGSSA